MDLPWPEGERSLLAAILMKEDEELTAERLEGAVRALRRIQIRRRLEEIQQRIAGASRRSEPPAELLQEKMRLKRALRWTAWAYRRTAPQYRTA